MGTITRSLLQNVVKYNVDDSEITINLVPDGQAVLLGISNYIMYTATIEQLCLGHKLMHGFCIINAIEWAG